MIRTDHRPCPNGLGAAFLAAVRRGGFALGFGLIGGGAHAQEFVAPAVVEVPVVNGFQLDDSIFNQWIFGNRNRVGSVADQLDLLLTLNLAEVEHLCGLSESQRRKLLLAGRGDIKRFYDRVAEARGVFERLRHDQGNMNQIFQETQPLASALATGLFGEGSLFAKAVGTSLNPDQLLQYQAGLQARRQARYEAKVRVALATMDTTVGFTSDQFRRFAALILTETTPPAKPSGQFESNLVLLKIARIPTVKVRPLFDEAQWKLLEPQLQQARGMEATLRANNVLGVDEDSAPPATKITQ